MGIYNPKCIAAEDINVHVAADLVDLCRYFYRDMFSYYIDCLNCLFAVRNDLLDFTIHGFRR